MRQRDGKLLTGTFVSLSGAGAEATDFGLLVGKCWALLSEPCAMASHLNAKTSSMSLIVLSVSWTQNQHPIIFLQLGLFQAVARSSLVLGHFPRKLSPVLFFFFAKHEMKFPSSFVKKK